MINKRKGPIGKRLKHLKETNPEKYEEFFKKHPRLCDQVEDIRDRREDIRDRRTVGPQPASHKAAGVGAHKPVKPPVSGNAPRSSRGWCPRKCCAGKTR